LSYEFNILTPELKIIFMDTCTATI